MCILPSSIEDGKIFKDFIKGKGENI